jgi:transcription initiation factor TFIIB
MSPSETQISRCPSCGGEDIDTELGVSGGVCRTCGLVHDGDRWASDSTGGIDVEDYSNQSGRESDWRENITIQGASDKQLVTFLSKIDTVADRLKLSTEERNQAADIVTEAWNRNLMHGRDMEGMVAAGVYVTCRKLGNPRPITTVAAAADVEKSTLQNSYRILINTLELEINPPAPSQYIPYLRGQLEVPDRVAERASDILEASTVGGNPAGIAVAALYMASDHNSDSITLSEAGETAGVTKETVWRKCGELNHPQ